MDIPEQPPATLLIVDDTPPVLRALERQLEFAGYSYVAATNGVEAQAILEGRQDIDLVISDWLMPLMDGFALLSWVRNHPHYRHVPFIMLTGSDSGEDAVKALRAGANDYISKPYPPEEMLARVATLLENSRLRHQLQQQETHDALTGLPNRRSCDETLRREIARVRRYGSPLSLILFAIDHLQRINDAHGREAGDLVLEHLGTLLRDALRTTDSPCRFDGGRFLVLLPHTDLHGASVVAERLCAKIAAHDFAGHAVTCSFGAASFNPAQDDETSVLQRADHSLQAAQEAGRNRVSIAPETE